MARRLELVNVGNFIPMKAINVSILPFTVTTK